MPRGNLAAQYSVLEQLTHTKKTKTREMGNNDSQNLDQLLIKATENTERLAALEKLAQATNGEVGKLSKYVLGQNGQKGLLFRVEDIEKREEEKAKDQRNLKLGAYGIVIGLIINFVWSSVFAPSPDIAAIHSQLEKQEKLLKEQTTKDDGNQLLEDQLQIILEAIQKNK